MSAPRRTKKTKRQVCRKGAAAESRPDPLIALTVARVSREITVSNRGGRRAGRQGASWGSVPTALEPFLQSLELDVLGTALRTKGSLYWHPLVQAQIGHLVRLAEDPREWDRQGWYFDPDEAPAPKETLTVRRHIENLVSAHAAGTVPGKQVIWKVLPRKGGPKTRLTIPNPRWQERGSIEVADLAATFEDLRRVLGRAKLPQIPRKASPESISKLGAIVRAALGKVGPDWSGFIEIVDPPGGRKSRWDWVEQWPEQFVREVAQGVITRRHKFARRDEGAPAFVAYAILAKLLKKTPEQIRDKVDSYRRASRRSRGTRESSN